jgi:hypothetical protein
VNSERKGEKRDAHPEKDEDTDFFSIVDKEATLLVHH